MGPERVAEPRFLVRELHMVDWHDAPESAKREDVFLLPPRWALQNLRRLAVGQALGFQETGNQEEGSPRSRNHTLLWIQRATATTRRVANEEALLHAMMAEMGSGWQLKVFSDIPPAPTAHEAGASLPIHSTQQLRPGLQIQIGDASRDWIAPIGEHHRAHRQRTRSPQEFEVISG